MTSNPSDQPLKINSRRTKGFLRRWGLWIGLGVLVFIGLVLLSAPTSKEGSTYERSPTGYFNWYSSAQKQGVSIKRWQKNYAKLAGTGQTLIQIRGDRTDPPNADAKTAIDDWVAKGNTLISLEWAGRLTAAPFSSQLASPVGPVLIETIRRQPTLAKGDQALLRDKAGSAVWSSPESQGQQIKVAYPWLAANAYPANSNNYKFLTRLVQQPGGQIWVDEWMHGYRDPLTPQEKAALPDQDVFDYLSRTPVFPLTIQSFLILLLLVWAGNRRFGQILAVKKPDLANSERYIQSLAGVLNNARHSDFVLQQLGEQLRQQLATKLGVTADRAAGTARLDDQQLAVAWANQSGKSPQEVLNLLGQVDQKRRLSDREVLDWINRAELILKAC
ncbi:MAG: DUF4350 domain-containing protein [Aphanocapsa sp. GSE-SYN-MK-11-07L]|jgi:hypothetical protein|nr:DUF4350 domain-containing protein [Aphanocapsa sp. GSE-SYN-MK-11-07L]